MRKVVKDTYTWRRRKLVLLEKVGPRVIQCAHCGNPVVKDYCCTWCHSENPEDPTDKTGVKFPSRGKYKLK
jgi:hypothetical protein